MSLEKEIATTFRNEYHKGVVNLYYTNNLVVSSFTDMIKSFGLAPPQFNVLRILRGQFPQSASVGLIKSRMLDKNSDVSRIVERLYKKGLVERTESEKDRRQKDVKISEKGLELLDEMVICETEEDARLKNLTDQEVTELNRLLDKVRG